MVQVDRRRIIDISEVELVTNTASKLNWLVAEASEMHVASAYVKASGISEEMRQKLKTLVVNNRESCFLTGASDLSVIQSLVNEGRLVFGINKLHAKLYPAPQVGVLVTSANLTYGGLYGKKEAGFFSSESNVLDSCFAFLEEVRCTPFTIPLDAFFSEHISNQAKRGTSTILSPEKEFAQYARQMPESASFGSAWKEDILI